MTRVPELLAAVCVAVLSSPALAASVSFVDRIDDGTRDYFNGFEAMATGLGLPPVHSEGGLTVTEVNFGGGIDTTFLSWGAEGARAWHPRFGLSHFSSITRDDGGAFAALGLRVGSASLGGAAQILYRLFLNGVEVQSGSVAPTGSATYVSFLGGGFDRVDIRETTLAGAVVFDAPGGWATSHVIDSIEALAATPAPVPLPAAGAFTVAALAALAALARRRRRA